MPGTMNRMRHTFMVGVCAAMSVSAAGCAGLKLQLVDA